jgi:hypothetical protein
MASVRIAAIPYIGDRASPHSAPVLASVGAARIARATAPGAAITTDRTKARISPTARTIFRQSVDNS